MRGYKRVLILAAAALFAGCGSEDSGSTVTAERGAKQVRGGVKADGTKSCVGHCGGKAIGCYCDSSCASFGDCCPDKGAVCDGKEPPKTPKTPKTPKNTNTCAGACGGQASGGCWCDSQCDKYGDCCDDHAQQCKAPKQPKKPSTTKCTKASDCGTGEFCKFEDGSCLWKTFTILEGVCTTKPDDCFALVQPVCGCNGQNFSNSCKAWAAGVSVKSSGKCAPPIPSKTTCGPYPGGHCAVGQFCEMNSCGEGGSGVCQAKPKVLDCVGDPIYPVCGCDGKTYSGDCPRMAAGVSRDHIGACK